MGNGPGVPLDAAGPDRPTPGRLLHPSGVLYALFGKSLSHCWVCLSWTSIDRMFHDAALLATSSGCVAAGHWIRGGRASEAMLTDQ